MITEADIEKAFNDPVDFRLSPWRADTAQRRPTISEIKARLLATLRAKLSQEKNNAE
ncbi:hypothetical protein [Rhizobium rhizogenes]|uniref:hypothetical protein n=1 Tax=Rhizobium rhizogenes TaxID=359 RepID=UPI00157299CD|nr:hypothetical protein [Rhizobium rhizogenes]NTF67916.1 hypothetical protein [Rhizobium rhizogenes]